MFENKIWRVRSDHGDSYRDEYFDNYVEARHCQLSRLKATLSPISIPQNKRDFVRFLESYEHNPRVEP